MKSYEYAQKLRMLAEFLASRPEFETGSIQVYAFFSYFEKEPFVEGVRASGAGRKEFTGSNIYFYPSVEVGIHLRLEVPRAKICRLVSEAVYDCDSLLSPKEEKELGAVEEDSVPF